MDIFKYIWGIFGYVQIIMGIIVAPVFLYGLLSCIQNAVQGKQVKEYIKMFILTAATLIMLLSPPILCLFYK